MSKIVVAQFLSMDGVMEAPEKWSFAYQNDAIMHYKTDELFASGTHLLGRATYDIFAAAWPSRTGEFADRMNSLPKYVVSTTLKKLDWAGSHQIKANVAAEITQLKQQPGKDILVAGSATLVQTLIQHNLVDEYRLLIYPLILGSGKRFFKDEGSTAKLTLVDSKTFSTGVVAMIYQPTGN